MHSADIQAALKKQGVTQTALSDELEVSGQAISNVIHRVSVSDRIMRAISTAIGKDPREVFPEYYLRPAKRSTSKIAAI